MVIRDQLEVFKWCLSSVEIGWSYQPLNNYNVYYKKKCKFLLEYFYFWNVGSFRYKRTRTILYSSRLNYLRAKCVYVKKKKEKNLKKKTKKPKKKIFQREMNRVGGCLPTSLECHGFRMRTFALFGIGEKCSECPCPWHLGHITVFFTYCRKG